MIYIDRTIIINKNEATIEEPIVLYRGDKNIEIQFTIENNPFKYKTGTAITYGQLIIIRPNAAAIIPEPAKISNGKVLFTIEDGMIDEDIELGNYDFQIRMINADQTSRGTLPPVTGGIVIKEPICQEATVNTTYANDKDAIVMPGNDMATYSMRRADDIFDGNGDYNRTNWYGGDIITDSKLNKIEEALYQINDDIPTDYATEEYVDDQRRQTEAYAEIYTDNAIGRINLNNYATYSYVDNEINKLDIDNYATKEFVEDAVSNVSGGGNVDLTGYATEQYVIDYTSDALGKYATKSYVDKAVANIEGGGTCVGLNIMTIGNGIDEYIFTGNEFTYEEYTSYAGKSVLLDNVTINFADAEAGGKQRTVTYKNELVYVNFNGDKLFTIVSSLSERENERSQYSIGKDGTITRTYYTQYVTKEYIEESNFATNDYVTQYVGEALGKYAKQSYVNEMLGDIESLLGGI